MALGVNEGDAHVMKQPPRDPNEPILPRNYWLMILGYGLLISISILASLAVSLFYLKLPANKAITISFLTLGFSRLFHVFNMTDIKSGIFHNEVTSNPYVWAAIALCGSMLLAAIYLPGLAEVLRTFQPDITSWFIIIGMSLIPLIIGQTIKLVQKKYYL